MFFLLVNTYGGDMQADLIIKPSFVTRQKTSLQLRYDLHQIKSGHISKFSHLLYLLDKYDSQYGIPSELIKKIFSQAIEYISSDGKKNIQSICDLTDLIQNKFEHKLDVSSDYDDVVLNSLHDFNNMLVECNKSNLFQNQTDIHLIHNAFLKIITFHLKISLSQNHLANLDGDPSHIICMFTEYRNFLENKIHIEQYSIGFEILKSIQDIFDTIVHFIGKFELELEEVCHQKILFSAFDFIMMISTKYNSKLKGYFNHEIIRLAQIALSSAPDSEKDKLAKSILISKYIYEKFPHQIQERKHILLEEIENLMSSNDYYMAKRPYKVQHEYKELISFYLKVLNDCPEDIQARFRHGLVLKSGKLLVFDIFMSDLLKAGLMLTQAEAKKLKKVIECPVKSDLSKNYKEHFEAVQKINSYLETMHVAHV